MASSVAVRAAGLHKSFRLPHDRPLTIKERVLHPRRSRGADELRALEDVTFDVGEGEFFGIVGANGSGKSTLLKLIAGIYRPDRGEVAVRGRVSPFIELGVGFHAELTARENVVTNATLLGLDPKEAERRFDDVIAFAELEAFTDLKLKNYSSGMQVRLGFATAVQVDAEILLLDEVLAVGDLAFQERCFEVFRRLHAEGRTIILVTHDLSAVERFCERAVLLSHGRVVEIGSPDDVVRRYRDAAAREEESAPRQEVARWGDGRAEVVDAWVEADGERVTGIDHGRRCVVCLDVEFREDIAEPVAGITVRSESGVSAFVTNTALAGRPLGPRGAGERLRVRVEIESLVLASGRWLVSPAVARDGGTVMSDWREGLVGLEVRGRPQSGGLADLPHAIAVEEAP